MTMDDREFRTALSSFATGVTVVTAASADGIDAGMTASSFNSVSMNPPLVLWSVTKTAGSAEIFRHARHYAIHVLAADQQALAMRFATTGIDKFDGVAVTHDPHGVPVLEHCVARFDCRQWAVYEGGDHWIIVGEVLGLHKANADTLVFCEGAFGTVNSIRQPELDDDHRELDTESPVDHLLLYNLSRAYRQMSRQFHASVRESGLTVPQWRILASLYGSVTRDFRDLQDRTFLEPESLRDALAELSSAGLCQVAEGGEQVHGTEVGHERVRHLFELGREQELAAADEQTLSTLIEQLSQVVKNTT